MGRATRLVVPLGRYRQSMVLDPTTVQRAMSYGDQCCAASTDSDYAGSRLPYLVYVEDHYSTDLILGSTQTT